MLQIKEKRLMKKHICSLLIIVIIAGCMVSEKRLAAERLSGIRKIVVVPVEPPPLTLGPAILEALGDVPVISGYPPEGVAALTLISGIVVLTQQSKYEEKRENVLKVLEEWYSNDKTWVPTRVLAQEAANKISKTNSFEVILKKEMLTLPVEKRETTLLMENWYAPLRAWYNKDTSTLNIDEYQRQGVDAILEVGIVNYDIYRGYFVMQVLTKLVSVPSGKVEARARFITDNPPPIGLPDELFRNQGEKFKKIFMIEGRKQLNDNLKKIGLLP